MIRSFILAVAALALGPTVASSQVVYAWGENLYGELGNGMGNGTNTAPSNVPVAVSMAGVLSGQTATAVAAGSEHNVALADGNVYAWGLNNYGQLGNGTTISYSNVPVAVSTAGALSGQTATAVAAGAYHSLAVANGQVYAWGFNGFGQLGNGSSTNSNVPVAVSTAGAFSGQTVTSVAAGYYHSLAVANGQAYAWGYNADGELGNGTTTNSSVPVALSTAGVLGGKTVMAVAAGDSHSLAVANGQVYAWGYNAYGELGNSTNTDSNVPVAVSTAGVLGGKTVTAVAAGEGHSLALANGQVYAWGFDDAGQLGNGTTTNDSNAPVALRSLLLNSLDVTEVAAGSDSSYALTSTGRLFAWGDNTEGELGIGSTGTFFSTPQEVLPPSGYIWTSVDSDAYADGAVAIAMPVPEPGTMSLIAAADSPPSHSAAAVASHPLLPTDDGETVNRSAPAPTTHPRAPCD